MWATLALAVVLQPLPAQANTLAIKNDRITYGILGPERKDNKLLAGDVFVVSFDIDGLQIKEDGKVQYSMGMELTDAQGKVQFKKEPADLEAVNALGGSRLPAFALSDIGLDTPPGEYTLTVTVTDRSNKATQKLVRKFEVQPKKRFGIVRLVLINGNEQPVPPIAVPGQKVFVSFALAGFDLTDKKQPNINVEMRILDESSKPTLPKPFSGDVNNVEEEFKKIVPFLPMPISVNRTGKFTIELKATDKISGKSVVEKLPITVVEVK